MEYKNIIDLPEIEKRLKPSESKEEIEHRREILSNLIIRTGLNGFFSGQKTPDPVSIVLDYDIEEIKKEIGIN